MNKGVIIAIIIVVAIALIVVAWIIGARNSMVTKQADVENGWAQVENQYQQRLDLIGNLVETVKGAAKQELTVFTEVTKLRSQWAEAVNSGDRDQEIATANKIDGVMSRLLLVSEDYPELKSNDNFLRLQDQLEGMEHRIATERMRYNDSVTVYNKYIRIWPNSSFAVWFGFSDENLFEAEQGAEDAPVVEFDIQPISPVNKKTNLVMPKALGKLGLVAILMVGLLMAGSVWAGFPQLGGRVNDYAGVLSPATVLELEQLLEQYDNETTNEIVVVVVPDMEGVDIDSYRTALFDEWNLGKEETDNGVLLVIAIEERDVGIEVGYGLEGALTDSTAGAIIRNNITPYFKEGDYDSGVILGVDSIIAATKGEYIAEDYAATSDAWDEAIGWIMFAGFMGFWVLVSYLRRRKRRVWDPKKKKWIYKKTKGNSSWWIGGIGGGSGGGGFGGGGFSGGGGGSGGGGASGGW